MLAVVFHGKEYVAPATAFDETKNFGKFGRIATVKCYKHIIG